MVTGSMKTILQTMEVIENIWKEVFPDEVKVSRTDDDLFESWRIAFWKNYDEVEDLWSVSFRIFPHSIGCYESIDDGKPPYGILIRVRWTKNSNVYQTIRHCIIENDSEIPALFIFVQEALFELTDGVDTDTPFKKFSILNIGLSLRKWVNKLK